MEQEVANKMIVFGDGDLRQVQRVASKGLLHLAPVQRAQSHRKTAERQLPFGRFVRYLCMVEPRFDPDSTKNSLVHSLHFFMDHFPLELHTGCEIAQHRIYHIKRYHVSLLDSALHQKLSINT